MKFSYQARTKEGEIQSGFVEAFSREGALSVLQQYGLYVTFLVKAKEPFWQKRIEFLREGSRKDIVHFTRQLSIMLKSNIPVVESLETIARQLKKIGFQEKILKVAEQVEGGDNLSKAVSTYPKLFSPLFTGMIKAGEASGKVPESLDYLADYLEREQDFSNKLISAIIYPAFILFVFLIVLFTMAVFVVPKFQEIFIEMGADLPFVTKVIIGLSNFMINWWWFIGFIFIALGISAFLAFRAPEGKKFLDNFTLKIPIFGEFSKKIFLGRIALNLSTLIAGGVPMMHALEITSDVVGNDVYKRVILKTRDGVQAGKSISLVLSSYPELFPLLFLQMVIVGEKTGHLEKVLQNVIVFYQKEVDRLLESLIKLLEPVLIMVLGGLVIFLALGLFIPLFERGMGI
ncbi:MAG: type II secretion system F family protein [Candidatus Pacebacteria bacterium]|nr:type II secretion system F family protein [Candidatus Paceibacterota bacterium]